MANNKLREALENVAKQLIDATEDKNFGEDVMYLVGCMRTMSRKCRAALAEPVKNCEVGTPEEQAARMNEFCNSHGHGFDGHGIFACENCKLISIDRCELAWAQMPYVEKEGENDGNE